MTVQTPFSQLTGNRTSVRHFANAQDPRPATIQLDVTAGALTSMNVILDGKLMSGAAWVELSSTAMTAEGTFVVPYLPYLWRVRTTASTGTHTYDVHVAHA